MYSWAQGYYSLSLLTKVVSELESLESCDLEMVSCCKLKSALKAVMSAIEHMGCSVGRHVYLTTLMTKKHNNIITVIDTYRRLRLLSAPFL